MSESANAHLRRLHGLRQDVHHGMWWPEHGDSAPPPPASLPCKAQSAIACDPHAHADRYHRMIAHHNVDTAHNLQRSRPESESALFWL